MDQVEELFTHGSSEADRLTLLRALIHASQSCDTESCAGQSRDTDRAPAVVLLGLRADFYAHCARIPELVPHLQDSQVLIAPMTAAEQREAIVAPAEQVGLQVEDALADLLVAESSGEALPQLAHVLRRTFANRTGRTLTAEGYPGHRRHRPRAGPVNAVAFSPDGITLATASDDRTARLWNAIPPPDKQIRKICNAVGRNLTEGEWFQYLSGQPYSRTCQG